MSGECELCRLDELADGTSKGIIVTPGAHYADVILVRRGAEVYAWRNCCPHTGAPMEWQADQFLDYTGEYLQCGIHGALFRVDDGYCLRGPCVRQRLYSIAVVVRDGRVIALDADSLPRR
ncbi:Rieske (2Fe-2S) protein [Plasticicumulans acidivorans]|uniref:Nitrite reductase/ring-hydroxylating ferredoxin subunit n=1 Tax=Plasticicumulans acidivorans TaxID=886464 RepID=A0A317MYY2_9GAMM|nr:Rieske 2Fe-2S domain-containing protein [Plasticicumulans acidivorans]PWV64552.1 nitrite reductase/ring-hydroxylating ferredoxin subunit [Plasticicumulans acidivorans]